MEKINDTTFDLRTIFPNTNREDVVAIVGGDDPLSFKPHLKLSKWDGEVELTFALPVGDHADPIEEEDRVIWKSGKQEVRFYEKGSEKKSRKSVKGKYSMHQHGAAEFDVILSEKPDANIFQFTVNGHENLDFFYQTSLTTEEKERMELDRPPHIEGSYAVYHKTRANNKYKAGKVCHIYRPVISDVRGDWVWGDLDYSDGILIVTVPQMFLDSAEYPVSIDPTFGYETAGGTGYSVTSPLYVGSLFTGAAGTATHLSSYRADVDAYDHIMALYLHSDLSRVAQTSESSTYVSNNWETLALASSPTLTATGYVLCLHGNYATKTFTAFKYDAGDANQGHIDNTASYSATAISTLGSITHNTNKWSIHCDYTEDAGGTEYNQSVAGIFTALGMLTKTTNTPRAGIFAASGVLAKQTSTSKAGTFAASGTVTKQSPRTFAGVFGASGVLARSTGKALSGVSAFSGTVVRAITHTLAGIFTGSGTLTKSTAKPTAGSLTFSGAVSTARLYFLALAGVFGASGILVKQTGKALAGVSTFTGTLVGKANKALSGVFTTDGAITKASTHTLTGIFTGIGTLTKSTVRSLTGAFLTSGTVTKITNKTLAGISAFSGTVIKAISRPLTGIWTGTGIVTKTVNRILNGIITFVGSLAGELTAGVHEYLLSLAGILGFSGTITKSTAKPITGSLILSGVVSTTRQFFRTLVGALDFIGVVTKSTNKSLVGIFTSNGTITKAINKTFVGIITFTGTITKTTRRKLASIFTAAGTLATNMGYHLTLSGELTASGTLTKEANKQLTGALSITGTIQKSVSKVLAGIFSAVGSLLRKISLSFYPVDVEFSLEINRAINFEIDINRAVLFTPAINRSISFDVDFD